MALRTHARTQAGRQARKESVERPRLFPLLGFCPDAQASFPTITLSSSPVMLADPREPFPTAETRDCKDHEDILATRLLSIKIRSICLPRVHFLLHGLGSLPSLSNQKVAFVSSDVIYNYLSLFKQLRLSQARAVYNYNSWVSVL